jgi:hypothetical protein
VRGFLRRSCRPPSCGIRSQDSQFVDALPAFLRAQEVTLDRPGNERAIP